MKKWWWIAPVLAVGGFAWWWFAGRTNTSQTADMFRKTAVVRRGDLVVSISATGTIDPIEKVDVKSKASGEIIELPIQEGDYVHKGDLIARIDRTIPENDFEQAKADNNVADVTVRQRKREMDRLQSLYDAKLASESELDNAKLAYEEANSNMVRAKSALSTAADRLKDTEIHSPIDGLILARPVEIGQIISSGTTTVTGGTLLCTVANMSQVDVVADVDETDIGKVKTNMAATITPDAFPDMHLKGTVLRVAPLSKVQQNVTVFEVTSLVDNTQGLLKAGMNTTVEVVTEESDSTLLVPVRAVEYRSPSTLPGWGDSSRSPLQAAEMRHHWDSTGDGHRGGDSTGARRWAGDSTGEHRRFAQNGGGQGAGGGSFGATPADSQGRRRQGHTIPMVQVRKNGVETWVPVRIGLTGIDDIEILRGVAEGDTLVYSLSSGALQQRQEMMQRMVNNSAIPGMRRSN